MANVVVTEITAAGLPFLGVVSFDLDRVGYKQAEYMVSGVANAYARSGDGVSVVDQAEYATRLLVYRPRDSSAFNGTVWVEWLNVSPGFDVAVDWMVAHTEFVRAGAAWAGVSAQAMGVCGGEGIGGLASPGLVGTDPERYGALTHPGNRYSYDIYSQAGKAVRASAGTILEELAVERVLAIGCSQSAHRLTTYANDIDPLAQVFDGIFVHARGGFSAPLHIDSDPPTGIPESPDQFDADRRVPIMCVHAETDVCFGGLAARQDDDETFVLWEIAGTSHADQYMAVAPIDTGALPISDLAVAWRPAPEFLGVALDKPINAGPQHYVVNAAVSHFDEWVRNGTRPPHAARLETADGAFVTDEHGNVRGGIRTPHVDVPTAVLSGLGNGGGDGLGFLAGTTTPFDATQLAALYPSRAEYLGRFGAATDAAVAAGFVLAADAAEIKAIAAENSPLERATDDSAHW
jgi:Alpha/beta hydrolase domain